MLRKLTITNAKGVILHFFMRFVDLINLASEKCKIECYYFYKYIFIKLLQEND